VINLCQDHGIIKSLGLIPDNSVPKKLPAPTPPAPRPIKKSAALSWLTTAAVVTTIGALLSPFGIAWWNNSGIGKGIKLSSDQIATLQTQVQNAEKLLLGQPDNQEALKSVVSAKLQLADIRGTIGSLEKLATLNPDVPEYAVLAGQSHQYLGERDAAVLSYRKALLTNPHNIAALQGLASLLVDGNKPEAAIGIVQESIKTPIPTGKNADTTALRLLLAQIYVSQNRQNDALPIYDELIQTDGQDFRPLLAKSLVLRKMGNSSDAQALIEKAIDVAPAQYKDQLQTMAKAATTPTVQTPLLGTSPVASPQVSSTVAPTSSAIPAPVSPAPIAVPSAIVPSPTK
jgi:tetratricopeptide (TPR) repeat protein